MHARADAYESMHVDLWKCEWMDDHFYLEEDDKHGDEGCA